MKEKIDIITIEPVKSTILLEKEAERSGFVFYKIYAEDWFQEYYKCSKRYEEVLSVL